MTPKISPGANEHAPWRLVQQKSNSLTRTLHLGANTRSTICQVELPVPYLLIVLSHMEYDNNKAWMVLVTKTLAHRLRSYWPNAKSSRMYVGFLSKSGLLPAAQVSPCLPRVRPRYPYLIPCKEHPRLPRQPYHHCYTLPVHPRLGLTTQLPELSTITPLPTPIRNDHIGILRDPRIY